MGAEDSLRSAEIFVAPQSAFAGRRIGRQFLHTIIPNVKPCWRKTAIHKNLFTAAVCLLRPGVAGAAKLLDVPTLKEDLWKVHSVNTSAGQPPQDSTESLCRNHAYDQYVQGLAQKVIASCTLLSDVNPDRNNSCAQIPSVARWWPRRPDRTSPPYAPPRR